VSITAGHPVRVIQAGRAVSASAVSTSAASDTSCLLLLRSLQLTAGVGPTNRGCGLVAGPPGRIRWLIGPICCVTGSKRALELGGGRDGRLRARRTPDQLPPAQRSPAQRSPARRAPDGSGRRGHAPGARRVRASGTRAGRRRALRGRSRASGAGVGRCRRPLHRLDPEAGHHRSLRAARTESLDDREPTLRHLPVGPALSRSWSLAFGPGIRYPTRMQWHRKAVP
jgi:hypothetical protein